MKKLPALLELWEQDSFDEELIKVLSKLQPDDLPLKQLAQFSGVFVQDTLQFSLLSKQDDEQQLVLKISLFYQEIASMCPCSGQEAEKTEGHCEMQMTIDKQDGSVAFIIL